MNSLDNHQPSGSWEKLFATLPSDEECARIREADSKQRRESNYLQFIADLDDTYRKTSDFLRTPHAELHSLFEANAKCGKISFHVDEEAFLRTVIADPGPLYLFGPTGTGKTRAALRRACRMILTGDMEAMDLVRFGEVSSAYTDHGPNAFNRVRIRPNRLLIIDDFLNGHTIASRREAFAGEWFDFLDKIAVRKAPCIITANADPMKVADWFGRAGIEPQSVVRRIGQMLQVIPFSGEFGGDG